MTIQEIMNQLRDIKKFESKHGEIKMPTQGEGFSSFGVKPPKETLPN